MLQSGTLSGKRILITGGGSGLGLAMAERFAALGADLLLCGRRAAVLEQARESIVSRSGCEVRTFVCDVKDAVAVTTMFNAADEYGGIDVLVNNAAATFVAQTHLLSARAMDAILAPTLHGALYCTIEAGRRWIAARRSGVVLSILSTSTRTGRAFTVPSAMAKSGLLTMTRSLAVEWGPYGIRSVAIAPGPFPTPGATRQLDLDERGFGEANPSNPLGRLGKPSELAELAAFLISDCGAFINGEMIAIDGGQHLRTSGAEDLLTWSPHTWARLQERRKQK